nr:tetraacyldisaccharide 4'-kinase [uncultured Flavobacterium sp.]
MKRLRKILFPFSLIYGCIAAIRNFMFDFGWKKQTEFDLPVICVGNLSVGGTGKTPQIEYLIRLLSQDFKTVTLSRGYKRKTAGFYLADASTKMEDIGDEPFQYFSKFKNIHVAVDAKRVNGVSQILKELPNTEVILLDDAFQHRFIKAGFYILLTKYDELYCNDLVLPAGNLREFKSGAKRADVVIVTKCPADLSLDEQNKIRKKLNLKANQEVYFTTIGYHKEITNTTEVFELNNVDDDSFIAIAGIAKPEYFYKHLKVEKNKILTFPDHHHFSENDIDLILKKADGGKIITTEKDFMRLQGKLPNEQLFYLPIETQFLNNAESFNKKIKKYVGKSSRNSIVYSK